MCLLVVTVGLIGYGLFQVNSQYKDISDHIGSDASALNLRVKDGSIIGKRKFKDILIIWTSLNMNLCMNQIISSVL